MNVFNAICRLSADFEALCALLPRVRRCYVFPYLCFSPAVIIHGTNEGMKKRGKKKDHGQLIRGLAVPKTDTRVAGPEKITRLANKTLATRPGTSLACPTDGGDEMEDEHDGTEAGLAGETSCARGSRTRGQQQASVSRNSGDAEFSSRRRAAKPRREQPRRGEKERKKKNLR